MAKIAAKASNAHCQVISVSVLAPTKGAEKVQIAVAFLTLSAWLTSGAANASKKEKSASRAQIAAPGHAQKKDVLRLSQRIRL